MTSIFEKSAEKFFGEPGAAEDPFESAADEFFDQAEQVNKDKAGRLAQLFQIAQDAPNDYAAKERVARDLGFDVGIVDRNWDTFKKTAEAAKFDPEAFIKKDPVLADLMLSSEMAAKVVYKERGVVSRALEALDTWSSQYPLTRAAYTFPLSPVFGAPELAKAVYEKIAGEPATDEPRTLADIFDDTWRPPAPYEDLSGADVGAGTMIAETFSYQRKQAEISSRNTKQAWLDFKAATAKRNGEPGADELEAKAWEWRKETIRLQQEAGLPKDFGQGVAGQLLVDVTDATASQVDALEGLLVGGGTGAAVGAGIGAAVGALGGGAGAAPGALAGARIGAKYGGGAGTFVSSFNQEMGSAYGEFRDMRDNDGNPLDVEIAAGAALLYGAAAASIEVWQLSFFVKGFGPAGDMMLAGQKRAAVKAILADQGLKARLADIGRRWLENMATEGLEEGFQEAANIAIGEGAKLAQGGDWEQLNLGAAAARVGESAYKGAIGSGLGVGGAQAVIGFTTYGLQRKAQLRAAQKVAALADLAETEAAQTIAPELAKAIEQKTEATGKPVTEVWVDPVQLVAKLTELDVDIDEAMRSILGEQAEKRVKEAMAAYQDSPGARATLRIPLAEYLEKWGGEKLAKVMQPHTALGQGEVTPAEAASVASEDAARVVTEGKRIAEEMKADGWVPETEADPKVIADLEQQLRETGQFDEEDIDAMVAWMRANAMTIAERQGISVEQVFAETPIIIRKATPEQVEKMRKAAGLEVKVDEGKAVAVKEEGGAAKAPGEQRKESAAAPGAAQEQDRARAAEAAETLFGHWVELAAEEQRSLLYQDQVTGLLNERGLELVKPGDRGTIAEWDVEGFKFINDTFGHDIADALLAKLAAKLRELVPDAARIGGSLRAYVKDDAQAAEIRRELQKIAGDKIRVTHASAPIGATLKESIDASSAEHKRVKGELYRAGKLGHRLGAPVAAMPDGVAIAFEGDMPGIPKESSDAKLALGLAAEQLRPMAEQLKEGVPVEFGAIPEAALEHFAGLTEQQAAGAVLYDQRTGLLSEQGFRLIQQLDPKEWTAAIDMRSIRAINDAFGREFTDEIMDAVGIAMRKVLGGDFDVAHLHGDEYAIQGNDKAKLKKALEAVSAVLERSVFVRVENGGVIILDGVQLAHGIAEDLETADREALPAYKRKQEARFPRQLSFDEFARRAAEIERRRRHGLVVVARLGESAGREGAEADGGRRSRSALETLVQEWARLADDPKALKAAMKDPASPLGEAASKFMAAAEYGRAIAGKRKSGGVTKKVAATKREAILSILRATWPEGEDWPTEEADFAYINGRDPGPYPGGLLAGLDDLIQGRSKKLENKRVSSVVEFWELYAGRSWDSPETLEAFRAIKQLPGFESLRWPDEVEERRAGESLVKAMEDLERELSDEEMDVPFQGPALDWDGPDAGRQLADAVGTGSAVEVGVRDADITRAQVETAPSPETLDAIRAETGAPVSPDGSLSLGRVVEEVLFQTDDAEGWLRDFRRNKRVQEVYTEKDLDAFERGVLAARAIMERAYDEGIMPTETTDASPLRSNEDFGKSFDVSTVCPRQDLFVSTVMAVERAIGRVLSPMDRYLVGEMLREAKLQPACWYCYGQAARDRFDQTTAEFTAVVAEMVEAYRSNGEKPPTGKQVAEILRAGRNWSPGSAAARWIRRNILRLAGAGRLDEVRIRDLARGVAVSGATKLEREAAKVAAAHAQAATKQNVPKPWATLGQQIARMSSPFVEKLNSNAGLRMNSQTDFRPWHVIEVAQAIASMFAVGLKAHVYTKETEFLEVFGRTGIKFNLSAFYKVDKETGAPLLDERGKPIFDDVVGMDGESIERWIAELPRDAGGMLMAQNDQALLAGLEDDRIHMIIPYHAGAVAPGVTKAEAARDYTSYQHETGWKTRTVEKDGKKTTEVKIGRRWVKKGSAVEIKFRGEKLTIRAGGSLKPVHHRNDQERYFALCEQLGIKPKFAGLTLVDGSGKEVKLAWRTVTGKWRARKGYMKLIIDAARSPGRQVVPNPAAINWDAAGKIIDRWIDEGGDVTAADPRVVDYVTERIRRGDWPVKSRPDEMAAEAARQKVAEAAKRNREIEAEQEEVLFQGPDGTEKDLAVTHSISAHDLRSAAKIGGLIAPSIAVSRMPNIVEGFGEITLVAGPEMVDPERGTPLFDADIYSPTFPKRIVDIDGAKLLQLAHQAAARATGKMSDSAEFQKFAKEFASILETLANTLARYGEMGMLDYEVLNEHGEQTQLGMDIAPLIEGMFAGATEFEAGDPISVLEFASDENRKLKGWVLDSIHKLVGSLLGEPYVLGEGRKRYPATTEGILEAMTQRIKHDPGRDTVMYGLGAVRASGAKQFQSIDEVKSERSRLVSAADYDLALKDLMRDIEAAADEMGPQLAEANPGKWVRKKAFWSHLYVFKGGWLDEATVTDAIQAVMAVSMQPGYDAKASAKELGFELTDEQAATIDGFSKRLVEMETDYFEAKPQRVVSLDEFKVAVVPKSLDSDTLKILEDAGLEIREYIGSEWRAREVTQAGVDLELLFQEKNAKKRGPRGWAKILRSAVQTSIEIFLTDDADITTQIHEWGHAQLEMLERLYGTEDAPAQFKRDYEIIWSWLGAKPGEKLTRDQKEKFARGWEAYAFEGRAPSTRLAAVFQRIRAHLIRIYRNIKALGVELTDDVRGVFDRMLATDEEIEATKAAMGIDIPLFKSPEEAGMTAEQFAEYEKQRAEFSTRAALRVQRAVAEAQQKTMTEVWRKEVKKRKPDAEAEWSKRADVRAWRLIRHGEVVSEDGEVLEKAKDLGKLDKKAVTSILGPSHPGLKRLRGRLVDGGLDPSEMAAGLGFESARAMLEAALGAPRKGEFVHQRAEEMVKEAHPELALERDRIAELAARAFHQEGSADSLFKELELLEKMGGLPGLPSQSAMEQAAKELVRGQPVRRLSKGRAIAKERKSAEKAVVAAQRGDMVAAAKHRRDQIVAHLFYREVDAALEDRKRLEKLAKRLTDRKRRAVLGKAGNPYLDAADQILEAIGEKEPETDETKLAERTGLLEAIEKIESEEVPIGFDKGRLAAIVAAPHPDGWKALSVEDMRVIKDALSQIYTAARRANSIILDGKRVELEKVSEQIAKEAAEIKPDLGPAARSKTAKARPGEKLQKGRLVIQGIRAALTEPRVMIHDLGETARKLLWDRYLKATEAEDALSEQVLEKMTEMWDKLPEELQKRRHEVIEDTDGVEMPADVDLGGAPDRQWMWMVALNMGNASNADRLVGGYGWEEARVRAWLNRNMTREEWDFVQGVWDLLDRELFPKMAAAYKAATGIEPPKIPPVSFSTPFGNYRGGYFPAKYDPVVSRIGGVQGEQAVQKLYGGGQISMVKTFTKERARRYTDVVNLDWGVVPSHVASVIHYITHDEFVRESAKLIKAPAFRKAVQRRLGVKFEDQLEGWLRAVASFAADSVPKELASTYTLLNWGRSRFVASTLGYSLTVAGGDLTNPLVSLAKGDVSAVSLARAALKTIPLATYPATRREALEKSHVLRRRRAKLTTELRRYLGEIGRAEGKGKRFLELARESAWWLMDITDRVTSTVVWWAKYDQAKRSGSSEKEAIRLADSAVDSVMPSHDPGRQAAFLRDRRGIGAIIAFYGYFSKLYNANREIWRSVGKQWEEAEGISGVAAAGSETAKALGRSLAVILVANVLGELASGRGPEDEEEWPEWILRKTLAGPFILLPFVGTAAEVLAGNLTSYLWHGDVKQRRLSMRVSPALSAVERLSWSVYEAAKDDTPTNERVLAILSAMGVVFNLPIGARQVQRTAGYLTGTEFGADIEAGDLASVAQGVIYGPQEIGSRTRATNPIDVVK